MYCLYCQQVGCRECMKEHHQNHEPAPLAAVAKFNRSAILNLFKPLEAMVANIKEQSKKTSIYTLERKFEDLKQQVESHTKKGHKMLDIWKKAVIADLKIKGVKLGKEVSEVDDQLSKADSLVSFMNRFLQEGSDFQLVTAFSATSQKLHKTTDSLSHTERRNRNEDCDLAFIPEPIPESYGLLMLPKEVISCTHASEKAKTPIPAKLFCSSSSQTSAANSTCDSSSQTSAAAKSVCSVLSQTTHSGEIPAPLNASGDTQNQAGASACTAPQRPIHPKTMEFDAGTWVEGGFRSTCDLHDKNSPSTQLSHKALGLFQWLTGRKDEDLGDCATVFMCNKTQCLYFGERGWWTKGDLSRIKIVEHILFKTKIMSPVSTTGVAVSPVDGTVTACLGNCIAVNKFGHIPPKLLSWMFEPDTITFLTIPTPFSIAISDKHWVVLDKNNSLVRISKYSDGKDTHVLTFGSVGSGQGQFVEPSHVCCDSVRDRFIVSDTGNNRIQVFDMSGNYLWEAGQSGQMRQNLRKPWGLCLDGVGNIIVADSGNCRLVVLGWEKGDYLTEIPTHMISRSLTVDGRDDDVAYLIVTGLRGKMPVVQSIKLISPNYKEQNYGFYNRWYAW